VLAVLVAGATGALADAATAAPPFTVSGVVQSGGTVSTRPLAGIQVTLLEATEGQPVVLGQATSDADGRFAVTSPTNTADGVFYLSAEVDRGVDLVAVLGQSLRTSATVNELTTVAAGYAMAQFTRDGAVSGDPFALGLAAGMNDNIVDVGTGTSSPVLLSSPNADETISLRLTRSLANLLAACIERRSATAAFLAATKEPGGPPPRGTLQALANLARDPAGSVRQIDRLTRLRSVYEPALDGAPDNWSVAVKVNDTGNDEYLFGGPGNLALDDRGYAWVTNNVVQGTPNSSPAVAVLKPNGQPADGADGTPSSPLLGAGVTGTGFGVTVDARGMGWFGNFGWGGADQNPQPGASISRFSPAGAPLSDSGEGGEVDRAQGMTTDDDGNVWVTSFGNDSVFVFPDGNVDAGVRFEQYDGAQPFDVAIAPDGAAWVTNSGGLLGNFPSSIARFTFEGGVLRRTFLRQLGDTLRGVEVDSQGNVWLASLGDGFVYGLRPDGSLIGLFDGGGIDGPWDVTIDGDDNLWVVNFGQTELGNVFEGRLTKLCGSDRALCPPGAKTGDAITPTTGYTMPSAGSQVLLHDGSPLYGPNAPPSFIPMMRQTASVIDRAGNLWTVNNWKPNLTVDATVNPGGDGILIFVGLAPPPRG
jgi:hypothetical protein